MSIKSQIPHILPSLIQRIKIYSIPIVIYFILGSFFFPDMLVDELNASQSHRNLLLVCKMTLLFCLGMIVLVFVLEKYKIDVARLHKTTDTNMLKNITLLSQKILMLYLWALAAPGNRKSDIFLALLLVYILLKQKIMLDLIKTTFLTVINKQNEFISLYIATQGLALAGIIVAFIQLLFPAYKPYAIAAGYLPILMCVGICVVDNSNESIINATRFFSIMMVMALVLAQQPTAAYYLRIPTALYNIYWDACRAWKWNPRFIYSRNYRIDLPLWMMVFGVTFNTLCRLSTFMLVLEGETRMALQAIRTVVWCIMILERQSVLTLPKPNDLPGLFGR